MGKLKVHFIHEYNSKRFNRLEIDHATHIHSACGLRMHVPETRLRVSRDPAEATCLNCTGAFEWKLAQRGLLQPGFRFKDNEAKTIRVCPRFVHMLMREVPHVLEDMYQNLQDTSYGARFRYLKSKGVYAYSRSQESDKVFLALMQRFNISFGAEQHKKDLVSGAFGYDEWEGIEYMIQDQFDGA